MAGRDVERLKHFLAMITRKSGGIEGQIAALAERPATTMAGGLESASPLPGPAELARRGMESLALGREPTNAEYLGLEAIINAELRPAVDIAGGTFTVTHPLWKRLSDDAAIRGRIEAAIPSIGRVELPGSTRYPYGGTGFVVGDGLIMTNRHVAELFATGLGDRRLAFIDGAKAGIDFLREFGQPTGTTLMVRKVVMIHPYWDMALLAVDGLPATRAPLKLALQDARDLAGRDIFVVGYPAFDPRNPTDVQQNLFNGRFGVKRLQPGELQGGTQAASFGKLVRAATHDCSTLGGNSGSAVIDLETGQVLGLHFGGQYQQQNFCVPASELARDSRVIDTGIVFAATPDGGPNDWNAWWQRADATETASDATSAASAPASAAVAASAPASPGSASVAAAPGGGATVIVNIPLRVAISFGAASVGDGSGAARTVESVADFGLEALREPRHDEEYTSRTGYDPAFLDDPDRNGAHTPVHVAMPQASDPHVLARTRGGDDILHYQNFSIRMHAKRRLALVTASNVTQAPALRRPEPNEDYTRKGLTGLGKNDQERWFLDPRLDKKFQVPDVFLTKDRQAFDKGHIVRREDVAWGATYALVRRANGDTYHVTNCSPQVAGFNQSSRGEDNWGDLENHVLAQAASERLCVLAGPVLDPADAVFFGVGDANTTLRAKIPSRFWKVIVARVADGIAAYGFVLEQDLDDVQFEFVVPGNFAPVMHPIADIEALTGVTFGASIRAADQYDTVRGAETAARGGARRKRVTRR
ncbi:MAG: DNA/RNA non-specific endonuclease [Proteobacteria bacterium]|nr:DNA/RNA non-specific endonuclease [Pseudomonadota bacterium]